MGQTEAEDDKGPNYDYLLSMPMWNLTQEKKDTLCKNRDDKKQELKKLTGTAIEDMWRTDLDAFIEKLDEVEAKERKEMMEAAESDSKMKKPKGKKGIKVEALPSAHAIRIDPVIADDLKVKVSKAAAAKERKDRGEEKKRVKKDVKEEADEFDMMVANDGLNVSLSKKLGTPVKEKKKRAPKTSPSEKKGGKKKNPWSDSDASDVEGSDLSDAMDSVEVAPRERAGGKRAAANKAKFKFDDSGDSDKSDSDDELHDNTGIKEKDLQSGNVSNASDSDEFDAPPPKKKTAPPKKQMVTKVFNSDSEDDVPKKKKPAAKKAASKKLAKSDDLFDSM